MNHNGHIWLSRDIEKWEWYSDSSTRSVFLHFLLKANWREESYKGITLKRGQLLFSRKQIADKLGLSEQNVRTAISHLQLTNEITIKSTNKYSIVTICKYDSWVSVDDEANQQTNQQNVQQLTNNQPATNQPTVEENNNIINQEDKETKDKSFEKNAKPTALAKTPKKSIEERQREFYDSLISYLQTYPKEMIRAFYDYWSEANKSRTKMRWEMQKTWELSRRLVTWANNDKNFNKNQNNNYGRETITDKIQRSAAESSEFSRKLKAQREANLVNGDGEKVW